MEIPIVNMEEKDKVVKEKIGFNSNYNEYKMMVKCIKADMNLKIIVIIKYFHII